MGGYLASAAIALTLLAVPAAGAASGAGSAPRIGDRVGARAGPGSGFAGGSDLVPVLVTTAVLSVFAFNIVTNDDEPRSC